jgi:hypothetical protein
MPSASQRKEIGRAAYAAGSALAVRSARMSLAKKIGAARVGDALAQSLISADRTTTVGDYINRGDLSGSQIDSGREPYLLIEDEFNKGGINTIPVYDCSPYQEKNSGRCLLVLHRGEALVPADTLISWL